LLKALPKREIKASAVVYGRLPMMVTANCLKKTSGKCDKTPVILTLNDRYDKQFPVYTDCRSCYNVIYNSVPLSLHGMFLQKDCLTDNFRLDFTVEDKKKTGDTIRYFLDLLTKYREPFYREYTTGHYKRGVE
ncbi:MAG: U32 family peptidase, partial [Lachnospiraceae bacterium]|nr:U32 family peptidase [Lachnospiraceae bacterium]